MHRVSTAATPPPRTHPYLTPQLQAKPRKPRKSLNLQSPEIPKPYDPNHHTYKPPQAPRTFLKLAFQQTSRPCVRTMPPAPRPRPSSAPPSRGFAVRGPAVGFSMVVACKSRALGLLGLGPGRVGGEQTGNLHLFLEFWGLSLRNCARTTMAGPSGKKRQGLRCP